MDERHYTPAHTHSPPFPSKAEAVTDQSPSPRCGEGRASPGTPPGVLRSRANGLGSPSARWAGAGGRRRGRTPGWRDEMEGWGCVWGKGGVNEMGVAVDGCGFSSEPYSRGACRCAGR